MWIVGQRVFSEYEPELGLGLVIKVTEGRFIEVLYSGAELTRRYSPKSAPLKRIILASGQKVQAKDGAMLVIETVTEIEGLLLYTGNGREVWEYELGHIAEHKDALNQFLLGQWSQPKAFNLREQSWRGRSENMDAQLRGLVGPRVSLLPHQLYIASEASKRDFPRLLLSDEVGLGKTIEAGLIFSAMKRLDRAERVLILVPDALKHQWLAELYRHFNEMFSLVDQELMDEEAASQGVSAFQMNQHIICPIDLLVSDAECLEQALEEPWDLVIVDEAHHLKWSEEDPSPEWEAVHLVAASTRGLLLLTATPEFGGLETKFGLLNLVDPERFSDFEGFKEEAEKMEQTALLSQAVAGLDRKPKVITGLEKLAEKDPGLLQLVKQYQKGESGEALLRALIDRHGTGRVLVRNRRARLRGFPGRVFNPAPLEIPESWLEHLVSLPAKEWDEKRLLVTASGRSQSLRSKAGKDAFTARCQWLLQLLNSVDGNKVVLICSSIDTVLALEEWMKGNAGVRTAVFHERLEIVERDRQAAWFQQKDGAQILLCSEIGSEGRNFQFAHHLVLFDLPLHPDVLEQRIGRLDRIGQKTKIQVHVPYFPGTPEEVLVRWYNEGLESFTEAWNGGEVWETCAKLVIEACRANLPGKKAAPKKKDKLTELIETTRGRVEALRTEQRESLDVLVDMNSFDEQKGAALVEKIQQVDSNPALRKYMQSVFDYFGVEIEDFDGSGTLKATAHSLTFVENFPGLSGHGDRLLTYDRKHALSREEIAFLTWDHPMAQGALTLVLEGNEGLASAATWNDSPKKGEMWLELLFVLQVTAPAYLELDRYLPIQSWHLVVDSRGKLVQPLPQIPVDALKPLSPKGLLDNIPGLRDHLSPIVEKARKVVEREAAEAVQKATAVLESQMLESYQRLVQLQKVNPLVSRREIDAQKEKLVAGVTALSQALPRLDAIRVILMK